MKRLLAAAVVLGTVFFLFSTSTSAKVVFRTGTSIKTGTRVFTGVNDGDVGVPGLKGFGVGVCPSFDVPEGFTPLAGYDDPYNDNYGNYQYTDGSVMVFIPKFYYKVGTGSNGLAVNEIDIKGADAYESTAAANADGYALHRAFIDGGEEKSGFFIDKYICSNNGGIASSIKNGNPISTNSDHNPISGLNACAGNNYYETINAAHGRGSIFNVPSRFMYSALALLSMSHGDAATSTANCAWYDAAGTTNFPKGCNNDSLGDADDGGVSYTSDGYLNCGKTGSGSPFAKTTHNGQVSGVADLNGLMWEITLGLTRPGASATDTATHDDANAFYVLKESVALKDLQTGWHSGANGSNYEAWGDADHLALYYDSISIPQIDASIGPHRFGSGSNQVLSESTSGTNWLYTGLGIPKDDNGNDSTGANTFGNDYYYEYQRANLAVLSGGAWDNTGYAGLWAVSFGHYVFRSYSNVGFRAACYPPKRAFTEDIGVAGEAGFGVGICPPDDLPDDFTPVSGYTDPLSDNYGNYRYKDGSIMCFIPKFYYKIGTGNNDLSVNAVDIKGTRFFSSTEEANASGYALHRVFIDGGMEKSGFFIDKYLCSNNGGVASSIKNGDPISTHADHNPISGLSACSGNAYYETINAAHGRGNIFNVSSKFMYSALALVSMSHGDSSAGTDHCAWYDAGGTKNYPKGCNNNALSDMDDTSVLYTSDGYLKCAKTGSANVLAKTTHNGQNCGVADLNGLLWEIAIGITRPGESALDSSVQDDANAFYVLKESASLKDLQAGWHSGADGANYEAWGDAAHLSLYYDAISIPQMNNAGPADRLGSGSNQVFSEAVEGTDWLYTGLGIPRDDSGNDSTGTSRFGYDYFSEYNRANLAIHVGGAWGSETSAGLWSAGFDPFRTHTATFAGFRAGCYPDNGIKIATGDIGAPGDEGFGVGVCPKEDLPSGFTPMDGYNDPTSNNYGNYQYSDGSIMCFVPKFYYKVGTGSNGFAVNEIDIKGTSYFKSTADANAAGYALHRAFIDGGKEKSGFFVDKYMCSNNGGVASSIKNGEPLSTSSVHHPIADLAACTGNCYYETINAAHGRGENFNVPSKFIYSALAMLSASHGSFSSSLDNCAWYDAVGAMNYPKGCNDDNLKDIDDSGVTYTHAGHSTCGKTGSASPFVKTTHNGQYSGVADLNGLMFEVSLGLTRPGTSSGDTSTQNDSSLFYILKEDIALKDLQAGWHSSASGANYEAWGDEAHLDLYYDKITISHVANNGVETRYGNGENQVLSESISGSDWLITGLGFPKDSLAKSVSGTDLFGEDTFYEYHRANLCLLSSAAWDNGEKAGVWFTSLGDYRTFSTHTVGFRTACYPDNGIDRTYGEIGTPGQAGFGVGVCPSADLPSGFLPVAGYNDPLSANYGNYQYSDGSIMVFVPKYYYKIGTGTNGLAVNEVDIKGVGTFATTAQANAAGYALHRAFIDGGKEKSGFFMDKYLCSNNGGVASSVKNGNALTSHPDHNPVASLDACSFNYYYEFINAAKGRGAIFNVSSKFAYSSLALLSMAHGDASTSTVNNAWYDYSGEMNYPKGCNNNALGDVDDSTVSFLANGYSSCVKTGSGYPFAKTTHNGQNNGITDLAGTLFQFATGITRPGTSATDAADQDDDTSFYVLKKTMALKDLTSGWHAGTSGANYEAWGDASHLSLYYDRMTMLQIPANLGQTLYYYGNSGNQVLSEAVSGNEWIYTGLGLPKDSSSISETGTDRFGNDLFYPHHRANLSMVTGGGWNYRDPSGLWCISFDNLRTSSHDTIGFRVLAYPENGIDITDGEVGTPGNAGFGVGVCPAEDLPSGFTPMSGYDNPASDNYGNYQYTDGSVMCFIPKFYYKVGTGSNGLAVNVIDIKGTETYVTTELANADGYAIHRAFIDGGLEKSGFFIDKYMCSNNGGVASSVKNGNPISTSADHNPIAALDACSGNYHYEAINAAHGRGNIFNVSSKFMYSALAMLSMSHGDYSSSTTNCAWYDAGGTTNFPKGCNNDALGDVNDEAISYTSDGYLNCGKTGSGLPFAKTTHNGQGSGVADLNGLMFEVALGLTRPGTGASDTMGQNDTNAFYVLKESVALKDLQSGWHSGVSGAEFEVWGDQSHLSLYYDQIEISQIAFNGVDNRVGSGNNQVLSDSIKGREWLYTGLGIPKDNNGKNTTGTNRFGNDYFYEYHRSNFTALVCGAWNNPLHAGLWSSNFYYYRTHSHDAVGFRAACYPDNGIDIAKGEIGTPGNAGFGVGVCPSADLPAGFTPIQGYNDPLSENYGNYQYTDGSVMCFIPKFYYKVGTGANGLAVNEIDVKGIDTYSTTADANAAGYALHRAFIDGGLEKSGFFVDKYMCSNNGGVASSVKNGNPISLNVNHNPISSLTACSEDHYYEVINAAQGRDDIFNCASKFIYSALAILSASHGDAATATTNCAWYDAGGTANFPKGCNNNQTPVGDTISNADCNDSSVSYTSDGFVNCGKTGSGVPFEKTTHNGQTSGVADLNGVMYETAIGLTTPGSSSTDSIMVDSNTYYVLKESMALKDLRSGWHSGASGANNEAWGDEAHLSLYYDPISITQITYNGGASRFGSGSNQVLSEATNGTDWLYTGLGIPKDTGGKDSTGTDAFGNDYFFENYQTNLAVFVSGSWRDGTYPGLWCTDFNAFRPIFGKRIGFRAACYPNNGTALPEPEVITVEKVFNTYTYTADSSVRDISNGIDLADKGGLVWIKPRRTTNSFHSLIDTERGLSSVLNTGSAAAETVEQRLDSFNNDGFTLLNNYWVNQSGDFVAWTFREAPKFFDIVKYTGDGSAERSLSHDLQCSPGLIVVKAIDKSANWYAYHRSFADATQYISFNSTLGQEPNSDYWGTILPDSDKFYVSTSSSVNESGKEYIAYLFAHDDSDDSMIKCGSYQGQIDSVDLGFEPQYLMIKAATATGDWIILDNMRGLTAAPTTDQPKLEVNSVDGESTDGPSLVGLTSTGFEVPDTDAALNSSGNTYIYMAIRRPMIEPTSSSEAFAIDTASTPDPAWTSSFPVDMAMMRNVDSGVDMDITARLTQRKTLTTNQTAAETAESNYDFDFMDGWLSTSFTATSYYSWMFRRAKGFFDVVCYEGDGVSDRTVSHNLGVVPEMIWVKNRESTGNWFVHDKSSVYGQSANGTHLYLNINGSAVVNGGAYLPTLPTASVFYLDNQTDVNWTGYDFIALLFATLPGISKVGSYTGNGTSQTIDCGFSTGAKCLIIKRADATGDWYMYDSVRGIVAGNDTFLKLNTAETQVTTDDSIDPDSSGFIVNQTGTTSLNENGGEYIYYAIAE